MERACPVCKQQYEDGGNTWKTKRYDCYKNYRMFKRIQLLKPYKENLYITHPSVTKEEMDKSIADKKLDRGWGVEQVDKAWRGYCDGRFSLWVDNTNFD